jgi:hypothetical protein
MAASPVLPTEDGEGFLGIDDLHFSLQGKFALGREWKTYSLLILSPIGFSASCGLENLAVVSNWRRKFSIRESVLEQLSASKDSWKELFILGLLYLCVCVLFAI